jgi:hypothetical protein
MLRNNSELIGKSHANDERRDTRNDLRVGEKFQRGMEKFQREDCLEENAGLEEEASWPSSSLPPTGR